MKPRIMHHWFPLAFRTIFYLFSVRSVGKQIDYLYSAVCIVRRKYMLIYKDTDLPCVPTAYSCGLDSMFGKDAFLSSLRKYLPGVYLIFRHCSKIFLMSLTQP